MDRILKLFFLFFFFIFSLYQHVCKIIFCLVFLFVFGVVGVLVLFLSLPAFSQRPYCHVVFLLYIPLAT